ncbi:MAG: glycosyltransferase [Cyclobacteriaceae bacterium]
MKAILFSIGTRGDIEPFLAIAQILKSRKWDVRCVFPEQFRETVEGMGLHFTGFGKEFLNVLTSKEGKTYMGGHGSLVKRFGALVQMARAGLKLSGEMMALQHRIQQEENADRIIYHPKCNYALIWGMANHGKSIMVSPVPLMAHPVNHLTALGGDYGKFLNRLSSWITNTIKAIALKRISRKYHASNSSTVTVSSIRKAMLQTEKTLYTISPTLFPRPAYWPEPAKVVGYYELDKAIHWQPGKELLAFLEKTDKLVFISFGSMSNSNPAEKTRLIVNVLKKHNVRAIINTSWGGLEEIEERPENIFYVNNIPYDWIFPRTYAVIHHGGSGTTHTALKYGCPGLIIPHIFDQFFWSRTLSDLHLGPRGIPIRKLNEKTFEQRLLDLMGNTLYKNNAIAVSEKMKSESQPDKLYELIAN